jgi:putative nucleotidyltransferase with HDIG domain
MRLKTYLYVGAVTTTAIIWGVALYLHAPVVDDSIAIDVVLLAVLALAGEALSVLLPRSAVGSMAFIPYFALALIVPSWPSVLAVVIVRSIVDLGARRDPIKALFNISAHAVMECTAVTVFTALGGTTMLTIANVTQVTHVTRAVGGPALVTCLVALLTNNLLVAGAIAVHSDRSLVRVWVENHRSTVGVDFLATPLVFVFAWVYAAFGVIATATLWIPILGLRQLQRINLELEQTNRELLELMVKSLEARDAYTSGHSRRVQHYSTMIARAIGLTERQIEHVSRAALLHDVGKIHEKYAPILSKDDKLTAEEWATMKEHPVDGAELVATMSKLRDVVPSIRHHHENWDGTGYPDGLAGELIPLASRIIRFADTIDAMTTERPYRAPLTETDVRHELVRCRGTQFDPTIADKLLSSHFWRMLFPPASGPTTRLQDGPEVQQRRESLRVVG